MANNNPVQVVLKTDQYMKLPEGGGGGGAKDFFENRDDDFARHKQRLLKQVDSIRNTLATSTVNRQIGFVKVRLQSTALAKSHRPMEVLFKPKSLPLVGSGALGELYFEVTPSTLDHVAGAIERAELKVTKRDNKNKLKASSARSETGAIEDIALPTLKDKRTFGIDDARSHFKQWPGARYFTVELFVDETTLDDATDGRIEARRALRAFRKGLQDLSTKLNIWASTQEWKALHITTVQFPAEVMRSGEYDSLLAKVMAFLDQSPMVRRYALGASVSRGSQATQVVANTKPRRVLIPRPQPGGAYPMVGIVDAGVSRSPGISAWSAGALDYMREPDSERDHGTFIAGLLVNGAAFNPGQPIEADPCRFFDFDLFSEDHNKLEENFEQGFLGMMRQLDAQLSASKPASLRVINLSLNPEEMTDQNGYSPYAAILDQIADKHDVIFVISAGNLAGSEVRDRWPDGATPALQHLVSYRPLGADRLYVPGETARNITVGAFEPVDANGQTRPARYSRRGPATAAGIKPDFAHIGGCVAGNMPLRSIDHSCSLTLSEGTSYAAPLVAKTLALLDRRIEGAHPRELLMALMYHFAKMPALLDDRLLKDVCKDFAGFGIPASVDDMLATDDSAITLVFQDTLPPGMELSFDFAWPAVLIKDGVTRGDVRLTIAYSPPLDRLHQAEFARVNLDAYLRQEQIDDENGEISYKGRLKPDHAGKLEKNLIAHGAKWWPVKHYGRSFGRLQGTSNWRLVVDSLTRAGTDYPQEGVKFAVVLTISDPNREAHVFASTRQALLRNGVNLVDVRTAARARAR